MEPVSLSMETNLVFALEWIAHLSAGYCNNCTRLPLSTFYEQPVTKESILFILVHNIQRRTRVNK
jgi:hypothetical protein